MCLMQGVPFMGIGVLCVRVIAAPRWHSFPDMEEVNDGLPIYSTEKICKSLGNAYKDAIAQNLEGLELRENISQSLQPS